MAEIHIHGIYSSSKRLLLLSLAVLCVKTEGLGRWGLARITYRDYWRLCYSEVSGMEKKRSAGEQKRENTQKLINTTLATIQDRNKSSEFSVLTKKKVEIFIICDTSMPNGFKKYYCDVFLYLPQYDLPWPVYTGTLLETGIVRACSLLG